MCGTTATGALSWWGDNDSGQLGDGTLKGTGPTEPIPSGCVDGAAGSSNTCGRTTTGLMCFGSNRGLERGSPRSNTLVAGPVDGF